MHTHGAPAQWFNSLGALQATAVPPLTTGTTELGPGDCFAEVAYFTEVPKAEAVRSLTVCRVLVIPRR
jgi:CRP-like cAMP-binding protein